MREALVDPILLSVWPGLGKVALEAGRHLVETLAAERILDLPVDQFYDIERVEVQDGLARRAWFPRCTLYGWKNPGPGRDLLITISEAQPGRRGYELCRHVLSLCRQYGVRRAYTLAAMATRVDPTATPTVLGVANEYALFRDLSLEGVEILSKGQISGLNGVLLAAAADLGMEAICLLGEIPFYAVNVPNPKASVAVLSVFSRLAGVRLELTGLERRSRALERRLVELLDRMSLSLDDALPKPTTEPEVVDFEAGASAELGWNDLFLQRDLISAEDRIRIESLFVEAERDRSKAVALKNELDRLGAFGRYEDRFLDLFR
ncbi:MAG: PAC2 family protein [Planctomycetes bacterium]|nr:PAC2 family protein [Planctomycetota bacterium]